MIRFDWFKRTDLTISYYLFENDLNDKQTREILCVINDNSKFDDYWLFENDFGNKRLILWKISDD